MTVETNDRPTPAQVVQSIIDRCRGGDEPRRHGWWIANVRDEEREVLKRWLRRVTTPGPPEALETLTRMRDQAYEDAACDAQEGGAPNLREAQALAYAVAMLEVLQ